MLVLGRKVGEKTYIVNEETGDIITFTIVETRGKAVSVGLDGPKKYAFIREEVYDRYKDKKPVTLEPSREPELVDRSIHFSGAANEHN
jgi:carbon storage regulator CsrA